jgi:hypothetical protein
MGGTSVALDGRSSVGEPPIVRSACSGLAGAEVDGWRDESEHCAVHDDTVVAVEGVDVERVVTSPPVIRVCDLRPFTSTLPWSATTLTPSSFAVPYTLSTSCPPSAPPRSTSAPRKSDVIHPDRVDAAERTEIETLDLVRVHVDVALVTMEQRPIPIWCQEHAKQPNGLPTIRSHFPRQLGADG